MISKCRVCGGVVEKVLDLGNQPLAGLFPIPGEEVPCSPLELMLCMGECGLVQLGTTYDLNAMYGDTYGYRSGLNAGMVKHLKQVAARVEANLCPMDVMVDIGSNDGTLLGHISPIFDRIGVDPTTHKFLKFHPHNIKAVNDFFPSPLLDLHLKGRKAKVITSIAMFYDLEDPVGFVREVANTLSDDGVWLMECAYWPRLMEIGAFDGICHEHLEYYGLQQLAYIARRGGVVLTEYEFTPTNGGSVLCTFRKHGQEATLPNESWTRDLSSYITFKKYIDEQRRLLVNLVLAKREKGLVVAGYGASTKGNVLLHYYRLNHTDLSFIVDVNEDKWGRVTPGTNIPIVKEGEADAYVVLPWHFRDNILARERDKVLIFPLPRVEEVQV